MCIRDSEAADPEAMAAVIARVKEWEEEFGDLEVTTERMRRTVT